MKKKIYILIMLITCLSIATPAMASTGPFHDTVEVASEPRPNGKGGCEQDFIITSHFFWIPYNPEKVTREVSCMQVYQGYVD
jgi:hypothetical protein